MGNPARADSTRARAKAAHAVRQQLLDMQRAECRRMQADREAAIAAAAPVVVQPEAPLAGPLLHSPAAIAQAARDIDAVRRQVVRDLRGLEAMAVLWEQAAGPHRNRRDAALQVGGRQYR